MESLNPFETKENTKGQLTIAIEHGATWEIVVDLNCKCTPPLELPELREFYNQIQAQLSDLKEAEAPNLALQEEVQIKREFEKEKTRSTYRLARHIVNKYNIITVGEHEREVFVYQQGQYIPAENLVIFPEIQRILSESVTKNAKNETLHKIHDMTSHPRSVFTSADVRYIPLSNGVYDFEEDKMLPHSPDYRFTFQFPIQYNPTAVCPKTSAFLDQVLDPTQRQVVEEWLGYYFYRLYSFKKAIIFVGEGDTGKTTLLETISNLLGIANTSSISLQKIASDKFGAIELYGKHGNIVDELSAKDITDTGHFKMATGGGSITGEHKYGNRIPFINYSKLTFACNKIPDVKDMEDEAYFQRWMVISFDKKIEKKIPNFVATLKTEEERSGLFNLAMVGLKRLLANGTFSYNKNAIETKTEMMKSGSSIARFVASSLKQQVGNEVSKEDMYRYYVDYCTDQGDSAETMDMFGKRFLFYTTYASEGFSTTATGKRARMWRNVMPIETKSNKAIEEEFNTMGLE